MAKRKKRRKYRIKKVSIFRPLSIVFFGLLLIGGAFWIYKTFSKKEKIHLPRTPVERKTTKEVTLYFSSQNAGKLVEERREILEQPTLIKEIRELIEALIQGPRDKKLTRTLPPQVKLRSLYVDFNEAIAYVDFTENIAKYSPKGSASEILSVYAVANSITANFPEVKRVKILINGEECQTLLGHIDLTHPFGFNEGLLQRK